MSSQTCDILAPNVMGVFTNPVCDSAAAHACMQARCSYRRFFPLSCANAKH